MNPLDAQTCNLLRYRDIWDFYRQHDLTPRRCKFANQHWRLADQTVGWPNALPNLIGVAVATDGVLLLVRVGDGTSNERIIQCHLKDWVVQDSVQKSDKASSQKQRTPRADAETRNKLPRKFELQLDSFMKEFGL